MQGSIKPARLPISYRLGILLVMLVTVLLPVVYVSLIAAVGYAVYWHAFSNTSILTSDWGISSTRTNARAKGMLFLIYVAPMIIGVIMVIFMLKPLFSRPGRRRRTRRLEREDEPLLFALVDHICDAVRAPRPKRIDIDLQVNASASFRNGILSMLGSDLVLTIGLPLVAGLNMRQFAGVLAHEFGHFSQGAGMRMTYLVRTIVYWFERVVEERDSWDEQLIEYSRGSDMRLAWIFWLARGLVWLTRRILWCLMMVGHLVAGFMLRQMEFDADRYECRFSGSDAFTQTMQRLVILSIADQQSIGQVNDFYQEGRLVDDLPQLTLRNAKRLPVELRQAASTMADAHETGLFDTHPSNKDRIAAAELEDAPGIFRLKYPAAYLFRNFATVCREATVASYREVFGRQFDESILASVEEIYAHQEAELSERAALRRYFQGSVTMVRPLRVTAQEIGLPEDANEAIEQLRRDRSWLEQNAVQWAECVNQLREDENSLAEAQFARQFLASGVRFSADAFSADFRSYDKISRYEETIYKRRESTEEYLDKADRRSTRRLKTALSLLSVPEIDSRMVDGPARRKRCETLLNSLAFLADRMPAALALLQKEALLQRCLQKMDASPEEQAVQTLLTSTAREIVEAVRGMHSTLQHQRYPFEHAKGEISLADYILGELPPEDNLSGYVHAANHLTDTLFRVYARTLSALCQIAEGVESALGMEPLPDPSSKSDEDRSSVQPAVNG